jgi:hypothetical protein
VFLSVRTMGACVPPRVGDCDATKIGVAFVVLVGCDCCCWLEDVDDDENIPVVFDGVCCCWFVAVDADDDDAGVIIVVDVDAEEEGRPVIHLRLPRGDPVVGVLPSPNASNVLQEERRRMRRRRMRIRMMIRMKIRNKKMMRSAKYISK